MGNSETMVFATEASEIPRILHDTILHNIDLLEAIVIIRRIPTCGIGSLIKDTKEPGEKKL